MELKNAIQVFGTLTKQEPVFTIDEKVLPGTLVFEALAPFPGYYNDGPDATKPIYMYPALAQQYTLMDVLKATEKVEKVFHETFDAGKGVIQVYDLSYHVLRIRHLNRYDLIGQLQQAYEEHGILFLKKHKKYMEESVQINLEKFFNLTPLDEGIYLDNKEDYHAYLELPKEHSWKEFNELTDRVKYNWEESKFDAAMGAFYYQNRLHDFVRIYSNKLDLEYLKCLRKLYLEKIK